MKVEDLITDLAIEIVFTNTKFGSRTPRELIAKDLQAIKDGYHIGYTMQCCLSELGLIVPVSVRHGKFVVTQIGEKYLEILNQK
jgi:hypothetical protein